VLDTVVKACDIFLRPWDSKLQQAMLTGGSYPRRHRELASTFLVFLCVSDNIRDLRRGYDVIDSIDQSLRIELRGHGEDSEDLPYGS